MYMASVNGSDCICVCVDGLRVSLALLGTNISPNKALLKMIFLFPRWDMLVTASSLEGTLFLRQLFLDFGFHCSLCGAWRLRSESLAHVQKSCNNLSQIWRCRAFWPMIWRERGGLDGLGWEYLEMVWEILSLDFFWKSELGWNGWTWVCWKDRCWTKLQWQTRIAFVYTIHECSPHPATVAIPTIYEVNTDSKF